MDQLCAITNSKKLPTSQKEIQEFYEAKNNEESQFKTFVSKVMNSINAAKRLKTSSLYDNEMMRVEKELNNKKTVFEMNWSKEKQNIEQALMYSKYEISCKNLFDRVDDFQTTLNYEDENFDQIKKKLAELESELNEKYSHGIKLKDTISSQLKAKNKVLLEEIEGIINKLSLANMRIKEEEEFNHQIKCINDQCKNLIDETNSQLNNWKLQTTKQPINQGNNESLNEINSVLEEALKFKKNTTRTSDHLLRNIREKLSQKFGLKNSGLLNDLEKNVLENLSKVDVQINEFVIVETNIRQAISKSELEEKERLAVRKEEEEFNHQIKCINDQCNNLIEETNSQLNKWRLQTTKQTINQGNNESLNEINRIKGEMLKFKKNTKRTSDHLLRNIKEKLSQKFGLKNSGLLQELENGVLENLSKVDLLINEFVMVETNIRQAISKSELEEKEKLAAKKEEEEFNHQIKSINSQCKILIEGTKNQLNKWKFQNTKQPINQGDNKSLKEVNRVLEEMSIFKKNTTKTTDHLQRNIKERLSQKFGLKNSGLLQELEKSLLENLSKVNLLINEFAMIETNIRQAISESELQKKQMLAAKKGVVQKEITPPPRPPSPVIEDAVQKEATPPPRPPDPVSDSGRDTRDHSPASRSTTSGRELGPETLALKNLAAFERHSRPLGDLIPFPFLPDKQVSKPKKNKSKVPKPSKFTKGEMYYSDYESDFEGNIGVRWRGTQSDAEDVDSSYRKVKPILSKGFSQQSLDRKPSPPCPHQWESHEDIDILHEEIKNWNVLTRTVNTHKSDEKVTLDNADSSDSEEPQYYEATAIVRCHSNMSNHSEYQRSTKEIELPQTLPAKQLVDDGPCFSMKSLDSGSYSEENTITTASLSTVQTKTRSNYMKVKEKVMHFEKKVEEEHLRLALEEQFGECPHSPKVRPERIPGAVRVLPTPTPPGSRPGSRLGSGLSSRKNSLTRSSSTDNALFGVTINSASALSRSVQPSPLFGRRYQEHPPPMFVPPDFKSRNFMVGHVQAETISQSSSSFTFSDQHNQMKSPPPLEIVDSNEMSRFSRYHPSQRRSRSRSIMSEDEELERLSSPKLVIMANNLAKRDSIDGYDGDTDTLKSKKGSIKRNTSVHEAAISSSQLTTSSQYFGIDKKQSNSQSQIISQSLILNSTQQTQADNFPKSSGEMMPAKWLPQSVSDINHQPTYKSVKPCLSRNMSK